MIDTEHENAKVVQEWFENKGIPLEYSDSLAIQIYKDVSYYGKIVNSISYADRVRVMKKQISFIRKNILGLMYRENNSAKGIKCGYVYAIHNPAWEDYVKIGAAIDVYDRLASYQTSSPLRDYEMLGYVFSDDRFALEKEIHKKFDRKNEWIKTNKDSIKKFLKDHEDFPTDSIARFCLEETVKSIGECDQVKKETVEKNKVRMFLKMVKHTLKSISLTYAQVDVESSGSLKRKNKIWFHQQLNIFMVVEDDVVKVVWDKV